MTELDSNKIWKDGYLDTKRNLFIEASAGTGKTYTIQKLVSRLVYEGKSIEKILIVTYTEKAAGELKDRIRKELQDAFDRNKLADSDECPELDKEHKDLFEQALEHIDNAQIFTIHSFCQKTLGLHAYDAGRPFKMTLIDDGLIVDLIDKKLRDEWINDENYQNYINSSNEGNNKTTDELKKILSNVIQHYYLDKNGNENPQIMQIDCKLELCNQVFDTPEEMLEFAHNATFEDLKERFPLIRENLAILEANAELPLKLAPTDYISDFIADMKSWRGGQKFLKGKYRHIDSKTNTWPKDVNAAFTFLNSSDIIKNIINDFSDTSLMLKIKNKFFEKMIKELYVEWRKYKEDNKCQSYNDMIQVVHQAIMDENSLLKVLLKKEYDFAIIDEFQDTNLLQWNIFKSIFMEDSEHHIIVVGDPKQSIYSFQGADVNVYRLATNEIGNKETINTNFRSTSAMIEACNALFDQPLFFEGTRKTHDCEGLFEFSPSEAIKDENSNQFKVFPMFDGSPISPIWTTEAKVEPGIFANIAAKRIIHCCQFNENDETNLRVFDKNDSHKLRNVSFRDFAVLARTRSEMPQIEDALKRHGIPFLRYKDNNLFSTRECAEWISIFSAIYVRDFVGRNRRILKEALISDFLGVSLEDAESEIYDSPLCHEQKIIIKWRELARKSRWAELQETIYRDTNIEAKLSRLDKMQELARIRQIGNYAVEYLYAHACTLDDLNRHLNGLMNENGHVEDQDGNLVEKSSDFNAVQVMTIHASKGLEFPVVISVAGFKGYSDKNKKIHFYHDEKGHHCLSFDETDKKKAKAETLQEWQRLFYVAYTRASSIMMIPRYTKAQVPAACSSFEALLNTQNDNRDAGNPAPDCIHFMDKVSADEDSAEHKPKTLDDFKHIVLDILQHQQLEMHEDRNTGSDVEQCKVMAVLQGMIYEKSLIQHSYSSVMKMNNKDEIQYGDEPEAVLDDIQIHEEDGDDVVDDSESEVVKAWLSSFDKGRVAYVDCKDVRPARKIADDYPKGTQLGLAIHEIFEHVDFTQFARPLDENSSEIIQNRIVNSFRKYGFSIGEHEDWMNDTLSFVHNTLNAKLPVICGSNSTGELFRLHELEDEQRVHEMEFRLNINAELDKPFHEYFKGAMDLLFVRGEGENARYSILDWKSDNICAHVSHDVESYVDREFSVQRVLYSYCLIDWLTQFYPEMTKDEIFKKHFGGIYYAFVRGTIEGEGNGIYAQTWQSYAALEESYQKLTEWMHNEQSVEGK